MRIAKPAAVALFTIALVGAGAPPAQAQARVELGAPLVSAAFTLGDDQFTTISAASGLFGSLNPGIYGSFLLGKRAAIDPQLSFVWASFEDESIHALSLSGQFDYFLKGSDSSSPYVFASVGFLDVSDADYTPKTFGAGAGYRILVGERLAFRIDGRYVHYTGEFEGTDALVFSVAIGGVLGGK